MGLFDAIQDRLGMIDPGEDHLSGHGFNPSACTGCEYRDTSHPDYPCTLCGCSTLPLAPMDVSNSPPESCVRLDAHEEGS